jgi:hypothetical protein
MDKECTTLEGRSAEEKAVIQTRKPEPGLKDVHLAMLVKLSREVSPILFEL